MKVQFAPVLKTDYSTLQFNYDFGLVSNLHSLQNIDFLHSLKHYMQFNYGIGISLSMQPVFFSDKFTFRLESYITRNNYRSDGVQTLGFTSYYHNVTMSNIASEDFLSFQYTYPKGKWRPNAFIGLNVYEAISSDNKRTQEDLSSHEVTTFHDLPVSNFFYGYSGGVGINYYLKNGKIPFLHLAYENYYGKIVGQKPDSNILNLSLQAGIYF